MGVTDVIESVTVETRWRGTVEALAYPCRSAFPDLHSRVLVATNPS